MKWREIEGRALWNWNQDESRLEPEKCVRNEISEPRFYDWHLCSAAWLINEVSADASDRAVQNPKCLVPVKWRAQRVETVSKSRGKRQRHRRRIVHYARTHYIGSLQAFNYFNGNICKCIYKAFLSGINSATRKLQWFAMDGILLAWNREEPIIMHLGWVILEIKCKQKAE